MISHAFYYGYSEQNGTAAKAPGRVFRTYKDSLTPCESVVSILSRACRRDGLDCCYVSAVSAVQSLRLSDSAKGSSAGCWLQLLFSIHVLAVERVTRQ
ncbi:hypothetical protein BaRGS_00016870 [Batillaria attramentaria]|uniref:Uncharacterized protein n=1 Tax=Batillaria attramentaria TaxID=370345 RepID=A0ABD0KXQ7_9CAEN